MGTTAVPHWIGRLLTQPFKPSLIHATVFLLLSSFGLEVTLSKTNIHKDSNGTLHIQGEADIRLQAAFNGTVYFGDIDVMQMARDIQTMSQNLDAMWQTHHLNPRKAKIYTVGGSPTIDNVEAFDGTSWTTAATVPTARSELASVVFDNKLYAIGGGTRNSPRPFATVELFDGHAWSTAPPMPTARSHLAAALYGDEVFVVGGWDGSKALAAVEAFDGATWSSAPRMPTARARLAAAVFQDKLYTIGGWNNADFSTVEFFDGISWSSAPPMPTRRYALGAAVFDGKMYAVGGVRSSVPRTIVEVFDGSNWSSAPPMSTARRFPGVVIFHNNLYAISLEA